MKILAVDTSCQVASVAVMDDEKLILEYTLNHRKTHSQKLMPMIEEALKSIELTCKDIELFSASVGPGSFTGLRIGVTTIKAMAYAVGKPVMSVNTLDALAYNLVIPDVLICPIMDARNKQVYTAVYEYIGGEQKRITDYMGIHIDELVELLKEKGKKVYFVGDGVDVHGNSLMERMEDDCCLVPSHLMIQRASTVAYKAWIDFKAGKAESSFEMAPFYLRKSQAEREYDNRQQGEVK